MKSKFSPILKVKKQILDKIEATLLEIRYKINSTAIKISQVKQEILSTKLPEKGEFHIIKQTFHVQEMLNSNKKSLEQELSLLKQELAKKQELYKEAKMDYEKIKYLTDQELAEFIRAQKKQEQKELDEIATMRYKYSKKDESLEKLISFQDIGYERRKTSSNSTSKKRSSDIGVK